MKKAVELMTLEELVKLRDWYKTRLMYIEFLIEKGGMK